MISGATAMTVRRFIDRQPALASVKNKTLATHLLLSGIAPEFLTRHIPPSLCYMSCSRWVRLKQVVLYIESQMPGVARLMSYEQLSQLTKGPAPTHFYKFLREDSYASLVVDWAVARGLIQRNAEFPVTVYDATTLKQADVLFRNHNRLLNDLYRRAFLSAPPTPVTVALADLRKVFSDSPYLTEKALFVADANPRDLCSALLAERIACRRQADREAGGMAIEQCTVATGPHACLVAQTAQCGDLLPCGTERTPEANEGRTYRISQGSVLSLAVRAANRHRRPRAGTARPAASIGGHGQAG